MRFRESWSLKMECDTDVNLLRKMLKQQGNGPSTINRKTGLLKVAIDYAIKQGHIGENPLVGIKWLYGQPRVSWPLHAPQHQTFSVRDGLADIERKKSKGKVKIDGSRGPIPVPEKERVSRAVRRELSLAEIEPEEDEKGHGGDRIS